MLELLIYKIKSYILFAGCSLLPSINCLTGAEPPNALTQLKLPNGFEIKVFAKLEDANPRILAFDSEGNLFVSSARDGVVVMLQDSDGNGVADKQILISDKFNMPNGLVFVKDALLVANQDGVVKLTKTENGWSDPTPFISNLATGGHSVKSIKIGADNHLYINIGSSCNVCIEKDPTRATILRYTIEGQPAGALKAVGRHKLLPPIWARGLRNSQGMAWHPTTGEMFATNNGADMRSESKGEKPNDELPPEHLNKIVAGKHYGWPHCWGNQVEDPNFPGSDNFCKTTTPPAIMFPAHSTPIGITFLDKSHFPAEYKNDAIVAQRGSWNRDDLSGYKLVRVKFVDGEPVVINDFATGWINNNKAWGRPVDVNIGNDGALYVSDDRAAYIYRISYKKQ